MNTLTRRWMPSLSELVFASVLFWLFIAAPGAKLLLRDGDTGWHIRTGDYILSAHRFPKEDLFSFSRPGQEWFAWEWGSDVVFSLLHRMGGLSAVVVFCGVLIALTSALMFRYMLWLGADVLVSIVMMLIATSASTVHWLARPHLFTYLFVLITVWLLESDRRQPSGRVFFLVLLSALWTNLHGGFVALIAAVGIYFIVARTQRYAILLGLVSAATLLNPYTYHLHQHILRFLRSDNLLAYESEWRPLNFHQEAAIYFLVLLAAGAAALWRLYRKREIASLLLLLFWGSAALRSMRHILPFVVVAAPILAREISQTLNLEVKLARTSRVPWLALASVLLVVHQVKQPDFPSETFPVAAAGVVNGRRVFTSEHWGGYLIYRYGMKVFIDGRTDFYGPAVIGDYLDARAALNWQQIFDRYGFDAAMMPADWALATAIRKADAWRVEYDDGKVLVAVTQQGKGGPTRLGQCVACQSVQEYHGFAGP